MRYIFVLKSLKGSIKKRFALFGMQCALLVHCVCIACALRVRCVCVACALRVLTYVV